MKNYHSPVRRWFAAAIVGAAAFALVACSGSGGDVRTTVPAGDESLTALLPQDVADRGFLRVAVSPASPPYVFLDRESSDVTGYEIDLVTEAASRLGLTLDISSIEWANIIPSVQSGRYDIGMTAMGDSVEREEIVDMIDLYTEGTAITVPEENPHDIETIADVCGLKAAVVTGSFPVQLLKAQNERCDTSVNIQEFPSQNDAVAALRSGRADFGLQTSGVARYTYEVLDQEGGIQLTSLQTDRYMLTYHAMAVSKSQQDLRDAIIASLQSMVDDGTYLEISKKWLLEANVIDTITYNDAARFADDYLSLDGTPVE